MAETKKAPAVPGKEETVRIKLPRVRGNEEDVYVSVNDRTFQIKRGIAVDVPPCVAEVIRNSEMMEEEAATYLDKVERR